MLQLEKEKERRAADEERQAERARVRAMVSREQQEFSQMEKVRLSQSLERSDCSEQGCLEAQAQAGARRARPAEET